MSTTESAYRVFRESLHLQPIPDAMEHHKEGKIRVQGLRPRELVKMKPGPKGGTHYKQP